MLSKKVLYIIAISVLFSLVPKLEAQIVYEHTTNTAIYQFIDELAAIHIVVINSTVKPYSRKFIAEKLKEADSQRDKLNKRQREDLTFYLRDYFLELNADVNSKLDLFKKNKNFATSLNPLAVSYKDSLFRFMIQPVFGGQLFQNDSGSLFHSWWGAELFGYVGDNFGAYASLRDNHETQWLQAPSYFTRRQGCPVKGLREGVDYSEMRGGVTYGWNWGEIGLVKDHFEWGSNYHGANIFSGHNPSFAHLKMRVKPADWFEFNWVYGWLTSTVVDSTRSYWTGNVYRTVTHPKWLAANIVTITPIKRLNISVGNSVIISDQFNAAYMIPVMFYKSVDHTYNNTNGTGQSGQNAQMFLDISSRNINHLHLYMSLFIDELKFDRMKTDTLHNFFSWKFGAHLTDLPKNFTFTAEYTRTLPGTFDHNIATTTFASNDYTLGHYLRSNSDEIFASLSYRPIRGLAVDLSYTYARHGNNQSYIMGNNIVELQPLEEITWDNSTIELMVNYELVNNVYIFGSVAKSEIKGYDIDGFSADYYLKLFTPEYFWGDQLTLSGGMTIGF